MITNEYYIGESMCANIALDDYNGFRMQDYDFVAELYTERMMIAERIYIPKIRNAFTRRRKLLRLF